MWCFVLQLARIYPNCFTCLFSLHDTSFYLQLVLVVYKKKGQLANRHTKCQCSIVFMNNSYFIHLCKNDQVKLDKALSFCLRNKASDHLKQPGISLYHLCRWTTAEKMFDYLAWRMVYSFNYVSMCALKLPHLIITHK